MKGAYKRTRRMRFIKKKQRPVIYKTPRTKMGGTVETVKAEVHLPIYLLSQTGPTYSYSFSNTSSVVNVNILTSSIISGIPELKAAFNSNLLYSVNGLKMSFSRSINAAVNTVYQLPKLFFDVFPTLSANQVLQLNTDDVARMDTAYSVQTLESDSNPVTKYYPFKQPIYNSVGVLACGKGHYLNTSVLPGISVGLGYFENPAMNTTGDSPRVGTLLCTLYLSFIKKVTVNTY